MTVEKLKREDMDALDIALRASNAVPEEDYALLKRMHGKSIAEITRILDEEDQKKSTLDSTTNKKNTGS